MEYNHSNLFKNTTNIASNSSLSSINMVCNGIGMIRFELTDSIAASAIFSIITNIALSIVSVIGNGLAIYVLAFRLGFTSPAYRGIFIISVISFFYSSVTQILLTVTRFHDLINYHECQIKVVAGAFAYTCQCSLYTTITALAIDRYIAVVHHQYYNVKKVQYIYIILGILTITIWLPIIITSYLKILSPSIFKVIVSSYLLIHFVIIVFTYTKVMLQLAEQNKNRVQHLEASIQETDAEKKRRKEERRQNSVLFIIGFHTFCMLAKAGCFAARVGFADNYELEYHCQRSTQFLLILNTAMYPILYAWRIDALRNEMLRIVEGRLCFSSATEVEQNA